MSQFKLPILPFEQDVETKVVLKLYSTSRLLLNNGLPETIPNEVIVLNTLSLQEAKIVLLLKIL
jgi:hypothetical protein